VAKKHTLRHLRNYQVESEFKQRLSQDAQSLWKNQREIRQMLHPTLGEEYLPEEREMNTKTGLLSASRSQANLMFKSGVSTKNSIDQTPS